MTKVLLSFAFAVCLPALTGCGSGNDGKFQVRGTVLYAGQAVADGMIVFMPLAGASGGSEAVYIKNGSFSVRLPEGERVVQIYGFRPGPDIPSMTGGEPTKSKDQYIPEIHNVRSKLLLNVTNGMDPLIFDLEGIGLPPGNSML